jgi:hypothetical protein
MRILKRADIDRIATQRSDMVTKEVAVPEWRDPSSDDVPAVLLRVMSGKERSDYESSIITQRGNDRVLNLRYAKVKLVATCLIDPDSFERLFTDAELEILGQRSAAAIERLADEVLALNQMGPKDVEKIAQGLEKNPIA